ncbi:MAG: hypothetical protein IT463_04035 [Planctomycetes bacterium]|nr:hypothetical protein [Planctomycetota bacterium]
MSSSVPQPEAAPAALKVSFFRWKAVVLVPALLAAGAVGYWFMIDDVLREQLLAQTQTYAGENGFSSVEEVRFSVFGPKLHVTRLRAWQNQEGAEHEVLYVEEADLDIEFWPLLERRVVVNNLSATAVRWHSPVQPQPAADELPGETGNAGMDEYLKQAEEILNSEELRQAREYLEKLEEYLKQRKADEQAEETAQGGGTAAPPDAGPGASGRATYVEKALAAEGAQPRVVIKQAGLSELAVTWGRNDKERFARKITDLELKAESISSDPVVYRRPMMFTAAGNLDGEEARRVELGLTLRFDPDELVRLEQVAGLAGIKTLSLNGLADTSVFGDMLHDARISLTHFGSAHQGMAGRTRLEIAGSLQPAGQAQPARATLALWFGGYRGDGVAAALAPSGISLAIQDFPLQPLLKLAGGSPIPLADAPATISFGTCDERGGFDGPGAALTWHDGINLRMRLQVKGLRFAEEGDKLGGLPAQFVVRGLNRVVDGLGGLDLVLGFKTGKDAKLDLERPGLRAFVDAIVNALELSATDLEGMVELPFAVSGRSRIALQSCNADGSVRHPQLALDGEARHDFGDLRVALALKDVQLAPKPGQDSILGLPAADFCRAFNALLGGSGEQGLRLRTRLFDAQGAFSPALESPGLRGLVDAMAGVLSYTGTQLNTQFNLPVNLPPEAQVQLESVDADGTVRGWGSPGADASSLAGLRLQLRARNFSATPKAGQKDILGIPAEQFCNALNTFVKAQGEKGVALGFGVFDEQGSFSPTLQAPGMRGLLDGILNTQNYTGAELNKLFDLPFALVDNAAVTCASVDSNNRQRTFSGPGSESNDLKDLRLLVVLKNGYAAPKKGREQVMGIPADYFTFAWNKLQPAFQQSGFPLGIRVFDDAGKFAPSLFAPTGADLTKMLGSAVGVTDFQKNFAQLGEKFGDQLKDFRTKGLSGAADVGKGEIPKLPKDIVPGLPGLPGEKKDDGEKKDPPKVPELPKIPKLPWGK